MHGYQLSSIVLPSLALLHCMFACLCKPDEYLLRVCHAMHCDMRDEAQGLNRVQQAPQISRAMHSILNRCQRQIGSWVGSSVIHLGDHNVPNALMFIDKYTQVGWDGHPRAYFDCSYSNTPMKSMSCSLECTYSAKHSCPQGFDQV